jgi:hypothetical protein
MDDTLIPVPHSGIVRKIDLAASDLPNKYNEPRAIIQDVRAYKYRSSTAGPGRLYRRPGSFRRNSPAGANIVGASTESDDKIFKFWNYGFNLVRDSFIALVKTFPPIGVTGMFIPDTDTYGCLRYV